MSSIDLGLTHVALAVAELDRSIEFYATFGEFRVVHRRERHAGQGVAWISDGTRPFVIVLLEGREHSGTLSGWAHLGIGVASRDEVDRRLGAAAAAGHAVVGPFDSPPPVGYWGMIADPDGHNLEIAWGQEVGLTVAEAYSGAEPEAPAEP